MCGVPYRTKTCVCVCMCQASLIALKQLVLYEFLELSESSIHFSNASGRFLSISDEFSGDHRPLVGDHDR